MTIPEKRPCPCGWISPTTRKPCPKFLIGGIGLPYAVDASVDEETADKIIEVYKDAERLRFLIANPALCSVIQFQPLHKRRAWIDEHMSKPGRKKPK